MKEILSGQAPRIGAILLICQVFLAGCVDSQGPVWRWILESRVYADLVFDGDRFFIVSQAGEVLCGNLHTGERYWKKDVDGQIVAAPATSKSVVVAATDRGLVYGFEKQTGKQVWVRRLPNPIQAPLSATQKLVLVPSTAGTLFALSLSDGKILWSIPGNVKYNTGAVLYGNYLFIGGWGNKFYCLKEDGKPVWEFRAPNKITESPLIHRNTIYLSLYDGFVSALDVSSGRLKWNHPVRFPTNAVVIQEELLFASEGTIYILHTQSGELLRKYSIARPVSRLYNWSNVCLVVSGQIYRFDPQSGSMEQFLKTRTPAFKIAFADGMLFVTDEGRSLFAYRF